MVEDLKKLYTQKGEVMTQIELLNIQLKNINNRIVELLNLENKRKEDMEINNV